MKLDPYLPPYTKNQLKMDEILNIRHETIKVLDENKQSNFFDMGQSNFSLNTSPEARETKAKRNYWDFIKIKSFCTGMEIINKTKKQPTE